MDRATRDKFVAATDQHELAYGESACLETPPDLFNALDAEFGFEIDLCANEQNHLCGKWFGPGHDDPGVADRLNDAISPYLHWIDHGLTGFCNPPYGAFIPLILEKALEQQKRGFTSVFLLPLRASAWYTDLILPHYTDLRHLPRIKFWYHGKPKLQYNKKADRWEAMTALFDSIIVVYQGYQPGQQFPIPYGPRPRAWSWKPPIKSRKPYANPA